jgi:hypothetical protein
VATMMVNFVMADIIYRSTLLFGHVAELRHRKLFWVQNGAL